MVMVMTMTTIITTILVMMIFPQGFPGQSKVVMMMMMIMDGCSCCQLLACLDFRQTPVILMECC